MQHNTAMTIRDTFRFTGSARGVTHAACIEFVDLGIGELARGAVEEVFVILHIGR